MMAFTLKGFAREERRKNRVGIHFGQVPEIAFERGADRIDRPHIAGHGVDKACRTGFDHLEKWLTDRKLFAAGQHCVFENMWHAVIGLRRRGKSERKTVFGVFSCQMEYSRPRCQMLELAR